MINYQVTCIIFLLPVVNGVTLLLVSTGRKRDALLEKRELTPIPPPKLSSHLFSPNYDMGGGGGVPGGANGKEPTANAGDMRDLGLIPGLGRSPGGGHGNPLQYVLKFLHHSVIQYILLTTHHVLGII